MKKWQIRLATVSISGILMIVGLSLILKTFNDNIVFFYTPSEIPHNVKQPFRVGGLVKKDSITSSGSRFEFVLTDNNTELVVEYEGMPPALFKEGQGAVAFGSLQGTTFIAKEILAKHDENYTPREITKRMKVS